MNPTDWPELDEENALLARLTAGDITATRDVSVRYLPLLTAALAAAYPRRDADLYHDAAVQALLDFLKAPHKFDPARSSLAVYLRVAARGDFLNLADRERRARRGIPLDSVAEPRDYRNNSRNEDEGLTFAHPLLVTELAAFDADEQVTFELLRDGVRNNATCAARLGLAHLSGAEQKRAVKRLKDRVLKRLVRSVEGMR